MADGDEKALLEEAEREWVKESKKQMDAASKDLTSENAFAMTEDDLKAENSKLLDQLGEALQELRELRKLKTSAGEFVIPDGADKRESKIIELAKKNKSLRMNLSKEQAKSLSLQSQVDKLQDELQSVTDTQAFHIESSSGSSDEMKKKVQLLNTKLVEARSQLQNTKQELSKVQRALKQEVGDSVPISKVLQENGTWRGRAQEISILKDKVASLKEELRDLRMAGTVFDMDEDEDGGRDTSSVVTSSAAPKKDFRQERKKEIEAAKQRRVQMQEDKEAEAQNLQKDIADLKLKLSSVQARNKILDEEYRTLKEKFNTIVTKTKNDDEFIRALQSQNETLKAKLITPTERDGGDDRLNEKLILQERQIARQEQIIRSLRAELDGLTAQLM
ncbi:hypothetical protein BLNAU_3737 [Blattamonas nauphoetae]|uniref:Coiled-coil domain-containing protein 13 n=1 Tax=Blattamonas nauphoetae TaxID=2049346 RepID=A0ABQ9YBZ2_9EUKA|nr:hypothetical protein BLNAU_3737 [Blattamonas nauphoetae]